MIVKPCQCQCACTASKRLQRMACKCKISDTALSPPRTCSLALSSSSGRSRPPLSAPLGWHAARAAAAGVCQPAWYQPLVGTNLWQSQEPALPGVLAPHSCQSKPSRPPKTGASSLAPLDCTHLHRTPDPARRLVVPLVSLQIQWIPVEEGPAWPRASGTPPHKHLGRSVAGTAQRAWRLLLAACWADGGCRVASQAGQRRPVIVRQVRLLGWHQTELFSCTISSA